MTGTRFRGALAGAVLLGGGVVWAADPALPPPRPLIPQIVWPLGFTRPDPYAVWQNYAVDRQGKFRPLVAPFDDGLRYVATGEPYPWWQNHPRYFMPVIANAATFGQPALWSPLLLEETPPPATGWERMPYAEK